jgi:hypothetical protein
MWGQCGQRPNVRDATSRELSFLFYPQVFTTASDPEVTEDTVAQNLDMHQGRSVRNSRSCAHGLSIKTMV